MGLLDDAIRQHLDLKRRHGADPSDVAKLEHEAFGPIERAEALEADGPRLDEPEGLHGTAEEEELSYEAAEAEADQEWRAGHAFAAPPEPAPVAEPAPVDAPPAGGSVRLDDAGEQTVEFAAQHDDRDPPPSAAPGKHDELEETPEFLQETPEHDRLWFEQKPPRDFDF